jgi:hypothetical protein
MDPLHYRESLFFSDYVFLCYQLQHCGTILSWSDRMMSEQGEAISNVGSRLSGGRLIRGFVRKIDWCGSVIW